MLLPNGVYLAVYIAIVSLIFGYIIYQRLTWRIVVGTLNERETSTAKVLLGGGPNPVHTYKVGYSIDGVPFVSSVLLSVRHHGWQLLSAENQPVILLVNPKNQKIVKLLYMGDDVSVGRIWAGPATALILTLLFSWLIVNGLSSSLSGV